MAGQNSKAHKTIFHTTEKSNFILNMTDQKFNKLSGIIMTISFVLIALFSILTEILSWQEGTIGLDVMGWFNFSGDFMTQLAYDWRFIPAAAVGISGILCASIFIIAVIRQTLTKRQIIPCICAGIMFIFMYISSLNSSTSVSDYSWFLGYRYGRYEGFMVYLCYLLIFLAAAAISSRRTTGILLNVIMVIGFVQCIWSGLQCIPEFPGFYRSLVYSEHGISSYLPSGVTGSPIFFASLTAVCLSISVIYASLCDKKISRIIYCIFTLVFSFFLIRTRTLSSVISSGIILLLFIIISVISSTRNKIAYRKFALPLIFMLAGMISSSVISYMNGFWLLDGAIMWQDGAARLISFGYYTDKTRFNIDSITSLYPYLWETALKYIKMFPVTGLGPDGFIIPQMDLSMALGYKSDMTFDRPYNEYLFYAATLGIPFCIGFAGAVVYAVVMAVKAAVRFITEKSDWIGCALVLACVSYFAVSFINTSSATVTPFIWFILGISCSSLSKDKQQA
ncbi:MAG: O-antigen ligase family protein [Oscillospiraceae bacterium]|nr:O-antigen ligase family protein [Oscillospiraceae bacterium]